MMMVNAVCAVLACIWVGLRVAWAQTEQGDGGVLCGFYNGVTNKAALTSWCVGSAPYSPCSTGSGAWVA